MKREDWKSKRTCVGHGHSIPIQKLIISRYYSKCLGSDEIKPISGDCHDFWGGMGMMVVESIDSLWIIDLKEEYQQARDWIDQKLSYDMDHFTSVFETIIRAVGGLLSAYGLTGDDLFKHKAVDLADRLLRSKIGVFPKVSFLSCFFIIVAKCSFKFWRST